MRSLPRIVVAAALLVSAAPLRPQATSPAADSSALHLLNEGRVNDAQSLLDATLSANPDDSVAHQLLCRVFYAQNSADNAIHHCELAVQNASPDDPRQSDNYLWLGRAYGMKARHAGPITGFTLARRVHASFEQAVQLDPANVAALNDLGEYYTDAPSIVGGGTDRTRALAARIRTQYPSTAHRLLALVAQDSKDFATAESEFKLAATAPRPAADHTQADGWIDLAQFYQTQNRPDDALAAVKSALATDRLHGPVLVDSASILIAAHRAPDLAERCLRDYLASPARTDAAPAFKVHLQLSHLLAARGDSAGASREIDTARALAPDFTRNASHSAQGF